MLRHLVLLSAISLVPLSAQVKEVGPYRYEGGLDEVMRRQNRLALPSLQHHRPLPGAHRLAPVSPAELELKTTTRLAARAGIHRGVPAQAALESGRWDTLANGHEIWRMALQSPGAAGIRIHFRNFRLGPGARLWLHDGSGAESEIMGPYEDRGVYGDGEFWSDFVLSDTIALEYQPGTLARGTAGDALPFTIVEISHLLPGVLPELSDEGLPQGSTPLSLVPRRTAEASDAVGSIVRSLASPLAWASNGADPRQAAATCHLDLACFPEWAETARSVAHIVYEDDGSSYVCSGTLVRTTTSNNIPYFLTADHCISSDTTARTVQSFWQYQSARCDGPAPNKRDAQRTLGARYLVSEGIPRGDYSLIRLNSVPTGVVFSGWNANTVDIGTQLVGIHHPKGDYKRFSRGNRITTGSLLPGANPALYYTVSYSEGLIEGGSSGSGLFRAPGVLVGTLTSGPKSDTPCDIRPFPGGYSRFAESFAGVREYLEGRNTGTPGSGTPPVGGGADPQVLVSGVARDFAVGPVTAPTLLNGASGFAIDVPQGATRLVIKITSVGAEPELGFWARYESAPVVQNGRVVADHNSPGTSGFEELTIDARSTPALRSGRYYIALGLFTANVTARGSITATVTGTPAPTTNQLVSGQARTFTIGPVQSGTLINGQSGFRIEVPAGARRLDIRLAGARPELDMDLYVRFGQDVALSGTNIVADHTSTGDTGIEEMSLTQASTPPLRGGTYFIAIGLFARNVSVTGTITATITGGDTGVPPTGGNALTSGTPVVLTIPAQANTVLLGGAQAFQIAVPAGATRLDVRLSNATAGIDYDLFVRRNTPVEVQAGNIVSDYRSESDTGNEFISITPTSNPPLQPGSTYHIGIAVFTKDRAGSVTLTATVTGGSTTTPPPVTPPPTTGTGTRLTPGTPANIRIASTPAARLVSGAAGYYVSVPQGTQRLELQLRTSQQVDLDLFVRAETPPVVQEGKVVADYRATGDTGNETVVITGTAAQPLSGTYYVGIGVFTTDVDISATLNAVVAGAAATGPVILQSGVTQNFSLPAVSSAQLAGQQYAIDVPAGAARLELRLSSPTPGVDIDLYARFNSAPAVASGKVQADHSSEGATATEVITITPTTEPALRAGRYFIALGVFTTGTAINGSLVATVIGGGGGSTAPPPAGSRVITPQSPVKFSLPAVDTPTLFHGDYSFRVTVPAGTRRMQLRLTADAPSIDTDLYARYEADVDLVDGELVTDHSAESDSGNELLTVDSGSQPPLRAGTYYVSVGLFTRNTPASGTISVVFERDVAPPAPPPSTSGQTLESGRAAQFTLPATASPTLYFGDFSYRFNVPSASGRLQVVMKAADPAIDVDLYLRFGADIALDGSTVVADFRAQGDTGDETLSVASPNLRAGTYFIGFGLFTPNREAKGTITATFTPGSQPTGGLLKEYDLTVEPAAAPELELEAKPGRGSIAAIGSKSPELLKQRSKRGLVGSSKSEVTAK